VAENWLFPPVHFNAPTDVGFPDPFLIISAKADATKAERVSSRCHSASPPGLSVGDARRDAERRGPSWIYPVKFVSLAPAASLPVAKIPRMIAWRPGTAIEHRAF